MCKCCEAELAGDSVAVAAAIAAIAAIPARAGTYQPRDPLCSFKMIND